MTSIARKFSPTFVATITPQNIEIKTAANGDDYLICKGAQIVRNGRDPEHRTLMAFGDSARSVRDLLTVGEPVQLAVQFNGPTIKALGAPRPEQIERAVAAAARPKKASAMPKSLLQACIDAGGFDQNDRFQAA